MEGTIVEHIDGVPLIRIRRTPWRTSRPSIREKRPIWTTDEITKMLKIIKEKDILSLLYGGKYRKSDVFKVVAANLKKMGYIRTAEQISTKWKHLRLTYAHTKAESKSGILGAKQECAYYDLMDDLLGDKIHIVGVDSQEDNVNSNQEYENIEIEDSKNIQPVVEAEIQMEVSETEYSHVDFSQVEVIQTDASETDISLPGPSGHEEPVFIGMQEPTQEQLEFSQGIDSETTVIESSPKKTRKRRMFRNPPGRLKKSNEGTYSNALKSFTKEWESMMVRVAEKEREQDLLEKEREKTEQRRWEERLIEQQSEAMTKANSEFLTGLKGLFDELRK